MPCYHVNPTNIHPVFSCLSSLYCTIAKLCKLFAMVPTFFAHFWIPLKWRHFFSLFYCSYRLSPVIEEVTYDPTQILQFLALFCRPSFFISIVIGFWFLSLACSYPFLFSSFTRPYSNALVFFPGSPARQISRTFYSLLVVWLNKRFYTPITPIVSFFNSVHMSVYPSPSTFLVIFISSDVSPLNLDRLFPLPLSLIF